MTHSVAHSVDSAAAWNEKDKGTIKTPTGQPRRIKERQAIFFIEHEWDMMKKRPLAKVDVTYHYNSSPKAY